MSEDERSIRDRVEQGEYRPKTPFVLFSKNPTANKAYLDDERNCYQRFKHDALEDVGLLNHPKADKIFDYAWDKRHADGCLAVYDILCELADLLD